MKGERAVILLFAINWVRAKCLHPSYLLIILLQLFNLVIGSSWQSGCRCNQVASVLGSTYLLDLSSYYDDNFKDWSLVFTQKKYDDEEEEEEGATRK